MKAYKFLCAGGGAPFTGVAWPRPEGSAPGGWLEAGPIDPCRRGVHACLIEDLPYWIQDELWEVELGGEVRRVGEKLVAERGRLVGRVDSWNAETAGAFARDCVARTVELAAREPAVAGHATDAEKNAAKGNAAVTGFIASRAAELAGGIDAYEAERSRQAAWLAALIGTG